MVARYAPHPAGRLIVHIDADDFAGCTLHGNHALPQVNRSAKGGYTPGNFLPHLTRSIFGIQESLYQTGFRPLLSGVGGVAKRTRESVRDGFRDRQSFDALRTPFRGNLLARDAPNLLGIVLEEGAVQTGSEAVDEKIFQSHLRRSGLELRLAVA